MKVSCVSLLTAGRLVTNDRKKVRHGNGISSVASHHCIRSSHSFVAYGTASLHVSLITLCVSSDRKYSRQVEEVDHDG